jgi:hypothetical protein
VTIFTVDSSKKVTEAILGVAADRLDQKLAIKYTALYRGVLGYIQLRCKRHGDSQGKTIPPFFNCLHIILLSFLVYTMYRPVVNLSQVEKEENTWLSVFSTHLRVQTLRKPGSNPHVTGKSMIHYRGRRGISAEGGDPHKYKGGVGNAPFSQLFSLAYRTAL